MSILEQTNPLKPSLKITNCAISCCKAWVLVSGLWLGSAIAQTTVNLPDFGDSSAQILSSEQEQQLGQQVMLNARQRMDFIYDPLIKSYLTRLTDRLAVNSPRALGKITLNVVNDPEINAFAVPGGYLTFNTGLLLNADSDGEVAAVIAHELAHTSQRHIARLLERADERKIPAAAAIIGGLLVGGQAGIAALTTVNAGMISDQINYTRSFEKEADATGMAMLAASGFPPEDMPLFFEKLEKSSRLRGSNTPEFLRTHPLSSNRIADAQTRARRLTTRSLMVQTTKIETDWTLAEIKARITALYSENSERSFALLNNQLDTFSKQSTNTGPAYLGLALAYAKKGDTTHALSALQRYTAHPVKQEMASAEVRTLLQHYPAAIKAYQALMQNADAPDYIATQLSALYLIQGQYPKAIKTLRRTVIINPANTQAWSLLARAYGESGDTVEAALASSQYKWLIGSFKSALRELTSIDTQQSSTYLQQRVIAKKQQLEAMQTRQKQLSL